MATLGQELSKVKLLLERTAKNKAHDDFNAHMGDFYEAMVGYMAEAETELRALKETFQLCLRYFCTFDVR